MRSRIALLFILMAFSILCTAQSENPNIGLKQSITGTWNLVSVTNLYPDGSKIYPYGEAPKGMLNFDERGNYSI